MEKNKQLQETEFHGRRFKEEEGSRAIMLLTGPTGVGKTTIAKLTTRQIGFKSTIITPSMARTAERLSQMVKNTTQTHRLDPATGKVEKGALVVDELDTGSEAEIKELLKALFKGGKLHRPVICICTNPFLPSLKELREKSLWVHIYENS